MESTELSKMRLEQVAFTNGFILTAMIILFIVTYVFTVKATHFFFVLGSFVLIGGIFGFIKGDSTKSFIPILEKVAIYEKQKMGREWRKEQKTANISRLIVSGFLFLQSYMYRDLNEQMVEIDWIFLLVMVFVLLIFMNIHLIVRFKKVDRSSSKLDLKGYTKESNLIAGAFGILFALIVLTISVLYIFI